MSDEADLPPEGPFDPKTDDRRIRLVPRLVKGGYRREDVDQRRAWIEERTGARLDHVGQFSTPTEAMRGNLENPIGVAQVPLGAAGPLRVRGEHADGVFYVPLATTEGALLRSYERGMVALTRAGGAEARLDLDRNRLAPVFDFDDVASAHTFAESLPTHFDALVRAAGTTTSHGRLRSAEAIPTGRRVLVNLSFSTGDAHGMNMIVKAADAVCRALQELTGAGEYLIFSGHGGEKRAAGSLLQGGKGKRVTAGCRLPRGVVKAVLHAEPEQLVALWRRTVVGHLASGSTGYNGQFANGLTALYIACGQDVANVANSAVGITEFELVDDGDLYASVTLPALTLATVGGGTGLGTAKECLEMLGCHGAGKAARLAEITAATLLAGELSMGAAIASGEFVAAHEAYGRNRPATDPAP